MSRPLTGLEPAREKPRGRAALGLFGVLLPLAVAVVVSGPRVWKSVRSEPSASVAVASLPAQQPAAATQLPVEQSPRLARGQLASLGRFAARDPFASPLPARTVGAAAASAAPSPLPVTAVPASPVEAATPSAAPIPAPVAPAPASAMISVNGVPEAIGLKALFPAADPLFRLVALGAGEVQISVIAAASPAAATPGVEQTVTLVRDRTLTLLDTVSGARYELRLVSLP